jgi:CRP-like cAMP-binding protein
VRLIAANRRGTIGADDQAEIVSFVTDRTAMAADADRSDAQLGTRSMRNLMAAVTSTSRSEVYRVGDGIRRNRRPPWHSLGGAKRGSGSQDDHRPEAAQIAGGCSAAEERARIREWLADSDVFGALAEDDLDRVIRRGRTTIYDSGVAIFRKGDPAEELMIVLDGRVKLGSASINGREIIFDFIGSGRCFGEGALLDNETRRLEATAVRPSAVFALRRRDVLACLEAHPEIAVRIVRLLCGRLIRAMEMFEDRAQLALASRTARALLRLAGEHGHQDGGVVRIGLKISQAEIAALVGATREKVNRQLCAWCHSGILAVEEGHLTIHDPAALHGAAEDR